MPSSDYTTGGGGALKLKGAGGIDKKKKKKRPKPTTEASTSTSVTTAEPSHTPRRSISPDTAEKEIREASDAPGGGRQKTEAEKRHDEQRRKRLEDRLKKEGIKTHKEKVEELNKYLSGLSEHHDMPKIGPG
ncbi:DUF1754-domain-containing protein [Massarina eburnea CBS 473.64]|uniref:DUF1754-domain-containing protein n=1 Tax=Massarina eburnea CBS 473.64 TaxID=1395130 RepID=A0A6A6SBJ4_9PLEO|nr:DUF1754-domain-containing protein [Massarina eburnea CBS 473.64]